MNPMQGAGLRVGEGRSPLRSTRHPRDASSAPPVLRHPLAPGRGFPQTSFRHENRSQNFHLRLEPIHETFPQGPPIPHITPMRSPMPTPLGKISTHPFCTGGVTPSVPPPV